MPKKILIAKLLAVAGLVLSFVMLVTAQVGLIIIPLTLITVSAVMQKSTK